MKSCGHESAACLLRKINGINEIIRSDTDINEKMNFTIEKAAEALGCDSAVISLHQNGRWVVSFVCGFSCDIIGTCMDDAQEPHAVLALRTGKPVFIDDAFTDERVERRHMREWNIRSAAVVPLVARHIRGVLFLNYQKAPVAFNPCAKEFIGLLGSVMTFALQDMKYIYAQKLLRAQKSLILKQSDTYTTHLNTILNNMNDGVLVVNAQGSIVFINQTAQLLHQSPSGQRFNDLEDFFIHFDVLDMEGNLLPYESWPVSRVLKGESLTNKEYMVRHKKEKEHRVFSYSGSPLHDPRKNTNVAIVTLRDITDQTRLKNRSLEAEKEKTEAMRKSVELKDEFISLISHEFRTPITVIISALQALDCICRNELSVKAREYLGTIRKNAFRQLKLVNNFLDISRMEADRLTLNSKNIDIVTLTRAIIDSIAVYAEQKKTHILFSSTMMKKIVAIDEEKYERILLNLLSNAIKFTQPRKPIKVRLSQVLQNRKLWLCLQVRDYGIGIPADKQQHIFEKFAQVNNPLTRSAEGTGLGLSIALMFVRQMGGSINLQSKEGAGSTFTVMLPAVKMKGSADVMRGNDTIRLMQGASIEFSDV